MRTKYIDDLLRESFGFMYSPWGRCLFLSMYVRGSHTRVMACVLSVSPFSPCLQDLHLPVRHGRRLRRARVVLGLPERVLQLLRDHQGSVHASVDPFLWSVIANLLWRCCSPWHSIRPSPVGSRTTSRLTRRPPTTRRRQRRKTTSSNPRDRVTRRVERRMNSRGASERPQHPPASLGRPLLSRVALYFLRGRSRQSFISCELVAGTRPSSRAPLTSRTITEPSPFPSSLGVHYRAFFVYPEAGTLSEKPSSKFALSSQHGRRCRDGPGGVRGGVQEAGVRHPVLSAAAQLPREQVRGRHPRLLRLLPVRHARRRGDEGSAEGTRSIAWSRRMSTELPLRLTPRRTSSA